MKIIVLPLWLEQALERSKLPLSTLNDSQKMCAILSPADVAFYIYVQNNRQLVLPEDILCSFDMSTPPLQLTAEAEEQHRKFYVEMGVKDIDNIMKQLVGDSAVGNPSVSASNLLLLPEMLDEDTIVVRVRVGAQPTNNLQREEFYDELCKLYQLHKGFEALTKMPMFKGYLRAIKPY